jgi:hypothetical protein
MSRQRTRLVSSAPKLRVWVPSRRADPSWLHGDGAWLEHELQPAKWVAELHRYELDAPSAFVHRQGIDVRRGGDGRVLERMIFSRAQTAVALEGSAGGAPPPNLAFVEGSARTRPKK